MFEFVDHTADVAVRLRAEDERGIFGDATRALLSLLIEEPDSLGGGPVAFRELSLSAEDGEALLIDYLNELIFLFDTRRLLGTALDIRHLDVGRPAVLRAALATRVFDPGKQAAKAEVKAATFHGMKLSKVSGGIEALVVFDL